MTNEGQLTLELNVRTAEQQKQIDSFLIREENDMKARIAFMKNQYRTLVDAGFYSEDIDFKLGVCGEHGGDPRSIHFFHGLGLDYVSCSPFRVPVARLESGRAQVISSSTSSTA